MKNDQWFTQTIILWVDFNIFGKTRRREGGGAGLENLSNKPFKQTLQTNPEPYQLEVHYCMNIGGELSSDDDFLPETTITVPFLLTSF